MADRSTHSAYPIHSSGSIRIGELSVWRLGYGAMQITGPGIWGPPKDPKTAIQVLRRAIDLGVNLIDTADSYGPYVSEELICQALHPYPAGLVIATKAGLVRTGPGRWIPVGRPEYLRQECEMSLRRLRVERLDLFQLHRIDPHVPADEQFGLLRDLQAEGKVHHVGLSEAGVSDIQAAQRIVPIVTVQNRYNLADRNYEAVLDYCTAQGIGFIPWFPIASGKLARAGAVTERVARAIGATPAQVSLAWLLQRSPALIPIPGTASVAHLEENCAAAMLKLSDEHLQQLAQTASA
jgi:aryl-alcohol dehydrogenase-like predicted oxidoreductase